MKDVLLAGGQVGCHAGKRSGQIVEALDLGVGKRHLIEDEAHLLAGIEAFRKLNAVAQSKLQARRKFDRILFTPVGQVSEWQLAAERLVPVHVLNQLLDLVGGAARRIDATDQASHACAGDQVHWHVVLIEPLQHANVRQAKGPTPFEHQADLRPLLAPSWAWSV